MGKTKIRTTINPGVVLSVDDAELLDLTRQGLILDDKKAAKLDEAEASAPAQTEQEGA